MGTKEKQDKKRVDCEFCEGFIFLESFMDNDDVVCCEECGAEYLIEPHGLMFLQPIEEDDLQPIEEEDDDGDDVSIYDIMTGYDDDYSDGRYD